MKSRSGKKTPREACKQALVKFLREQHEEQNKAADNLNLQTLLSQLPVYVKRVFAERAA